jgi:hypothetical protein
MSPRRRRALATAVVTTAVLGALGLTESVLRGLDRQFNVARVGWTGRTSPLVYDQGQAEWNFNRFGARGADESIQGDELVVVLLGDSEVEAPTLANESMPESALERSLAAVSGREVRVVSLAASGWGQDQQLLALRHYFTRQRADIVVDWVTPSNDLWENAFLRRTVDDEPGPLKPTFVLDEGRLREPETSLDSIEGRFAIWQVLLRALRGRGRAMIRPSPEAPPIGRVVRDAGCKGMVWIKWRDYYGNDVRGELEVQQDGRYIASAVTEAVADGRSHFASRLRIPQPVDIYERQLMAALLAEINDLTVAHGGTFVTLYVDSVVQVESAKRIGCIEATDGSRRSLAPDEIGVVRQVAPSGSLVTVRLGGLLENYVSRGDRHLSAIGHERAMDALAAELVARGLVPRG